MVWFTPYDNPHDDPVIHWQHLVDNGLIGQRTETPPDIAANRARIEAIFLPRHRHSAVSHPRRERQA
jgi:hypothetical protein